MSDVVIVKIPTERLELLGNQFRMHSHIEEGNVYHMCVCEDCALYRTWMLTTMIGQQEAVSIMVAGMMQGTRLLDLMADDGNDEPVDPTNCGHCVHYNNIHLAQPGITIECCYCGTPTPREP